jgi:hypothetical protein
MATPMLHLHLAMLDAPDKELGYQPDWIQIEKQRFEGRRVVIDNHQFGHCAFERCTLIYAGGPVGFFECSIDPLSTLVLTGAAMRGATLLGILRDLQLPYQPPGPP